MTDRIQSSRQLNYDLQILYDYGRSQLVRKVILVFEDSEAFEGKLLAELVDVLRYVRVLCQYTLLWRERCRTHFDTTWYKRLEALVWLRDALVSNVMLICIPSVGLKMWAAVGL